MNLSKEAPHCIIFKHPAHVSGSSHCGSGDITYSICHVTTRDTIFKDLCDFMVRSFLMYILILLSLIAIDNMVVDI